MLALSHPTQWTGDDFTQVSDTLRKRIEQDLAYYADDLPDVRVAMWGAYLSGLREWGIITLDVFHALLDLLPGSAARAKL